MGSDQGKTANIAGLTAMASIQNRPIAQVGTTTFRPPFVPVPLEIYRGSHRQQLWQPIKRLPLEAEHRKLDAALCEYGGWLRPGWYGTRDPTVEINREVRMAREQVGIFDGSPLGKIEVMGPDAEAFLNFVYYNTVKTLSPGKIKYGFMLTEGGVIYDDGVLVRVDDTHFIVSCSSSHVEGVRQHLEAWRQDGNDPDRIFVHDVSHHWATMTVTGPKARATLETLAIDFDVSAEKLPHMRFCLGCWEDKPLRISRVSFSGDLSFEISVAADHAKALWSQLLTAGLKHGGGPLGLEALSIMRAEKGYIIVGKDTDGETMPHDLGFAAPKHSKTDAFVGDRSLHTEKAKAGDRKQLVGLDVAAGARMLPVGAHILQARAPKTSAGYVTSSYHSPTLEKPIALGLVAGGRDRPGTEVNIWHLGEMHKATICDPCFLDPKGARLHAR